MERYLNGDASEQELAAALPGEVGDVVARQLDAGIDIVSDGESGKPGYTAYLLERIDGFGGESEPWYFQDLLDVPELQGRTEARASDLSKRFRAVGQMPGCIGELRYVGHAQVERDVENLTAAIARHGAELGFMPAASPGSIAIQAHNHHYPSYEAYLDGLADALRHEYAAIVDAGLTLQLDCPDIPMTRPGHRLYWAADLVERLGHRRVIDLHVDAVNRAAEGLPRERVRMHLCWGNYVGPHHHDAPLRDVLGPVLERARVGAVSFEAANPRHAHEWEELAELDVPDDVAIIPGVIDSTTNFVEHPRLVAQRIERFARSVGSERVIGGSDCGFASSVGMTLVEPTVVWMKLRSLAEGAAMASDRLG
jgi:5-methyltetrahydropteroyltriglutamate--homocysteine methyltransferase